MGLAGRLLSSFASHAVLPLLRFVEEHTTLSDSNPDGAGWALTFLLTMGLAGRIPIHHHHGAGWALTYEEGMPSGGHHSPTAFILWPFPLSKKSPLDPPSPWGWLGAYLYDCSFPYWN